MPSFILIHPSVWPQYTNVKERLERQDRETGETDNGLIAQGELFWATVCKEVRPILSHRCLSVCPVCLSVTLGYCGQTVGWIKVKLGIRPRPHIVLDGQPLSQRGTARPIFGPYLLWPNGWMD